MEFLPSVVLRCSLAFSLSGEKPPCPRPTAPHRFPASDSCSTGPQLDIGTDGPTMRDQCHLDVVTYSLVARGPPFFSMAALWPTSGLTCLGSRL